MVLSALRLWRRYPLLCVPVFAADLLHFVMQRLLPSLFLWVAEVWPRPHSVLTGSSRYSGFNGFQGGSLAAVTAVEVLAYLLQLGLWSAALVLIGGSLRSEGEDTGVSWHAGWRWLKSQVWTVMLFAAGVWVVLACANAVLTIVFQRVALRSSAGGANLPWLSSLLLLPLCCAIGVVALRLLPAGERTNRADRRSAALQTLLWVLLSQAILMTTALLREPSYTAGQSLVIHGTISLLASVPYVILFFSLGLLVVRRSHAAGVEEQPDVASASA